MPRVVAAYGRQTVRLNDALHLIGMMLGGQAGVPELGELQRLQWSEFTRAIEEYH
jgi:hypothetical protein